jgi:hypothetical protein
MAACMFFIMSRKHFYIRQKPLPQLLFFFLYKEQQNQRNYKKHKGKKPSPLEGEGEREGIESKGMLPEWDLAAAQRAIE